MNTPRQRGWLYAAIAVNLLLWLAALGSVYGHGVGNTNSVVIAGIVFAAIGQHWAYYALWKSGRQRPSVP